MKDFYDGKVVWVIGATSGIGEELVKQLSKLNCKLILSARRSRELERVQKENGLTVSNSYLLPLDLEYFDSLASSVRAAEKKFGSIDVVFNNGGISQRSFAKDTVMATYKKIMAINFFGNVAITQAVLPQMRNRNSGSIVVISSIAGLIGTPLRTGYSASKFALQGFYESLQAELEGTNIRVTIVNPGFIQTNISVNALTGTGEQTGKMDEAIEKGLPVEYCARQILKATANRKYQLTVSGFKERFAVLIKKFSPSLLRKIVSKAITK